MVDGQSKERKGGGWKRGTYIASQTLIVVGVVGGSWASTSWRRAEGKLAFPPCACVL